MLNGCINFYTNKFQKELSVESILGLRDKDHFAVFRVFSGFHFFFFLIRSPAAQTVLELVI